MKSNVLFVLPYPLHHAPSQRFRVEAYFELLRENDIAFDTHCFFDAHAWSILYKGGSSLQKITAVVKGFVKRAWKVLFDVQKYDYVFIHREAAPLGPPVFEWLLAKVHRKKILYDFDDAIWIPNVTESNRLARSVKCFWKVGKICQWSHTVSAGNQFLKTWAEQYSNTVVLNPTCVDTVNKYNRCQQRRGDRPVIGWTGSHSTLKYLDLIYPVLQRLEREFDFDFLVICNEAPAFELASLRFIPWKASSEIEDLLNIDIGIMPLVADAWSAGKCGFKIIQYLALFIPAVASPVGVNKEIIEPGTNGFLCSSEDEWYRTVKMLLEDKNLQIQLGRAGRQKIEAQYSVRANAAVFLSLFTN
jgi:glycosyltransferase involved in cell wall biosynthesis